MIYPRSSSYDLRATCTPVLIPACYVPGISHAPTLRPQVEIFIIAKLRIHFVRIIELIPGTVYAAQLDQHELSLRMIRFGNDTAVCPASLAPLAFRSVL